MTTTYAVLLPGGEDQWRDAGAQERAEAYARHARFLSALAERGHQLTGGAELTHSSRARTVRATPGGVQVTEGPFAETAEQLTGFYLVDSDDLDDLCRLVGVLAVHQPVEVRPCAPDASASNAQTPTDTGAVR